MSAQDKTRRGPDFLCIGAQKSATTWLNWNLRHHPDMWCPLCKEIDYFENPNAPVTANVMKYRVNNFYSQFQNMMKTSQISIAALQWYGGKCVAPFQSDDWYLGLFDDIPAKVKGDVTPSNAKLSDTQVKHAHDVLGDDRKIIYFLRHPVERTWSQICQEIRLKRLPDNADMQQIKDHIDSDMVHLHSDYERALKIWSSYYPDIHVEFFDHVKSEPLAVLKRICDLIDLEYREDIFGMRAGTAANVTANNMPVPDEIAAYIAQKYLPMVEALIERFGGGTPADEWLADMQKKKQAA